MHPLVAEPTNAAIRVLLIHDRSLVRDGLCAVIEKDTGIAIVGSCATLSDAISLAECEKPDVLLVDVDREGKEDPLEFSSALLQKYRDTPVLLLAGLADNVYEVSKRAASLGVKGLVLKQQGSAVLIKAIKKIHAGEVWFDRTTIARILSERVARPAEMDSDAGKISTLTPREREVVCLVAERLKNKQIASRLFISETTVTHHLSSIFSKLGVSDRLELVIYTMAHRLANTNHRFQP